MTEQKRAYFYRLALAVLVVLVGYGIISQDDLPALLEVIAAALGVSSAALATKNTSTRPSGDT